MTSLYIGRFRKVDRGSFHLGWRAPRDNKVLLIHALMNSQNEETLLPNSLIHFGSFRRLKFRALKVQSNCNRVEIGAILFCSNNDQRPCVC